MMRLHLLAILAVLCIAGAAHGEDYTPSSILVCGTYEVLHYEDAFARDLLPGETIAAPRVGEISGGRTWGIARTNNGALNLLAEGLPIKGRPEVCAVYAFAWVRSDTEQDATLLLGSDDGCAAWLNGAKVHETHALRGLSADEDAVPIHLTAGWHRLLVKVVNNRVDTGVAIRIRAGSPIEFSTESPMPRSGKLLFSLSDQASGFVILDDGALGIALDAAVKNDSDRVIDRPALNVSGADHAMVYTPGPWQPGETRAVKIAFRNPAAVFADGVGPIRWSDAPDGSGELTFKPKPEDWLKLLDPLPLDRERGNWARANVQVGPELQGLSARLVVEVRAGQVMAFPQAGEVTLGPGRHRVDIEHGLSPGPYHRSVGTTVRPMTDDADYDAWLQFYHPDLELVAENLHFAELMGAATPAELARLRREFAASRGKDTSEFDALARAVADKIRAIVPEMKQYTLDLIGHAHIDMAWLWTIPETKQVCRNTFGTMLKIMDEVPDFKFAQSQPAAYEWMETEQPEVFEGIKEKVADGQWIPIGGMWVEPDTNIPSGEALVRQFLLGKSYFQDRFGVDVKVGWLPDSFGHSWQMPQIMTKCGIEGYVFGRCAKPDTPLFWWEAPDGSRVLGFNTWNYNASIRDGIADDVMNFAKQSGRKEMLYLHGVGDHGGGPTLEDLDNYKRLKQCAAAPTVRYLAPQTFFDTEIAGGDGLPVVRDELEFTFEGCYTTRADTKRQNRWLETSLKQAETLAAFAGDMQVNDRLLPAWKTLCFNQFHDIICGSSIHEVYDDANKMYLQAFHAVRNARESATRSLFGTPASSGTISVANTCEWERGGVVTVPVQRVAEGVCRFLRDESGSLLPTVDEGEIYLRAHVPSIPAGGSRRYTVTTGTAPTPAVAEGTTIENEHLRAAIDAKTGRLASLVDKQTGREYVGPASESPLFRLLGDRGDGWTIKYTGEVKPVDTLGFVKNCSDAIAQRVRVEAEAGESTFRVDYVLYPNDPKLYVNLEIDWREEHELLKMDFPFALDSRTVRCEIPFGSIERPANGHEYPMQRWIDLRGSDGYSVAILNDSKYGCSVQGSTASITLLRSTTSPDRNPDEGRHHILLALLPHGRETGNGAICRAAQEINEPLLTVAADAADSGERLSVDKENVLISATKPAEDGDGYIIRLYETDGKQTDVWLRLWRPITRAVETNMIERGAAPVAHEGASVKLHLAPWEVKTIRVRLAER